MKQLLVALYFIGMASLAKGNHTKGGWMYYKYLGAGAATNTARYQVSLKIYTECRLTTNQFCSEVAISIFNAGSNTLYQTINVMGSDVTDIQNCTRQECHPCITDIPNICYKITTFETIVDLPMSPAGYILSHQRCCRIANIINMQPGSSTIGDTWTVSIPGTNSPDPTAYKNSSALFAQNDTAIICKDNYFTFDFSAEDPDKDSLVYSFTDAYFASRGNAAQCTSPSDPPPFSFINYATPFSGSQPLGSGVTINPATGIVSGIAPGAEGTYVLTCTVTEYQRGTRLIRSYVQKSLHISVTDCSLTQALLKPVYFSCSSFTKSFRNEATGGNVKTYYWDFGVLGTADDTSNLQDPIFTYPDTGTYILKLVVNRNQPCSDSTFAIVKVYPVFTPEFIVQGQCKNTPIAFIDRSTSTFGIVNSWEWNFGDVTSATNTSRLQNPTHTFINGADYRVSLTASNTMGCSETLVKTIPVTDKPALSLTNDTLICVIDTLQLNAVGFGSITWSPNYNISQLAGASTLVSPDVPTMYTARITDPYGCAGADSVWVDVKSFVTLSGGNDTTICQTDTMRLTVNSDALYYQWTTTGTATSISNVAFKQPLVAPLQSSVYTVTASIGKCIAQDAVAIRVVPYPPANAGSDTSICAGSSITLTATGGSSYSWFPGVYLSNTRIPNPVVINPQVTTSYKVTVTDTLGCPKPGSADVVVNVSRVNADAGPRDTTVVLDQPLRLTATGGSNYTWSPASTLNNASIAGPVALPRNDIEYIVKVTNPIGCFAFDSLRVTVYQVAAGIYVPTAFSPNGDGRNDYFRPIGLGLKKLEVFRVYNRWGQILYSDTNYESAGWDGTFKGNQQAPATYVWYAEGIDFREQKVKRQGYVVLVR